MNIGKLKPQRIEGLGDGFFAIAMTLLVLDLKVPAEELIKTNADLWQYFKEHYVSFVAFFLSFVQLAIVWVTHHTQFSYIEKTSREMTWINIFLFLSVTLLPFITALLSHFPNLKLVIALYWLNNVMGIGLLYVNWQYVRKHNFVHNSTQAHQVSNMLHSRLKMALVFFLVGFILSFIISNSLSFILIVVIDILFIVPSKLDRKFRDLLRE